MLAGRAARAAQVEAVLGSAHALATLDPLELVEFAWHDCHGEITPPDRVVDDILICSRGGLAQMHRRQGIKVVTIALAPRTAWRSTWPSANASRRPSPGCNRWLKQRGK
jgi:hypothetical protein